MLDIISAKVVVEQQGAQNSARELVLRRWGAFGVKQMVVAVGRGMVFTQQSQTQNKLPPSHCHHHRLNTKCSPPSQHQFPGTILGTLLLYYHCC